MSHFTLQRSFRSHNKTTLKPGGSFFHRRMSSKSPSRNVAPNLTTEIHVDGHTLNTPQMVASSGTESLSSSAGATSSVEAVDSGRDSPANGLNAASASAHKVNRTRSNMSPVMTRSPSSPQGPYTTLASSTPSSTTSLRSYSMSGSRRSRLSSSLSVEDRPPLDIDVGSSVDHLDHPGILRRTKNKVVNAFK